MTRNFMVTLETENKEVWYEENKGCKTNKITTGTDVGNTYQVTGDVGLTVKCLNMLPLLIGPLFLAPNGPIVSQCFQTTWW